MKTILFSTMVMIVLSACKKELPESKACYSCYAGGGLITPTEYIEVGCYTTATWNSMSQIPRPGGGYFNKPGCIITRWE